MSPIQHWRKLALLALVTAAIGTLVSFLIPPRFATSASFIAEEGDRARVPSSLASLAGQFGISAGGSDLGKAQFYADLARSRSVLRSLLQTRVPTHGAYAPVIDLLRITNKNPLRRVELAEKALRDRIEVSIDRTTQCITVTVWMGQSETAKATADSLLAIIDQFNRKIRRTQASEKRLFAEAQLRLATDSLHDAEDRMASFLEHNRSYTQSAQLAFEHERLARAITQRQDVVSSLAHETEEARMAEVDTRPVLTVVDPPVTPAVRSWPKRRVIALLSTLVILAAAWMALVLRQITTLAIQDTESDASRAVSRIRSALQHES